MSSNNGNSGGGSSILDQQKQMMQVANAQIEMERSIYQQLSEAFPAEALSADTSRGFALTSIKAQYVVERLNNVFGIGGWRLTGNYEATKDASGNETGVLFHGELVVRLGSKTHAVATVGYSDSKKNKGDQYKGAKTDALSKAASYLGVGNEVFKGLVDPMNLQAGTEARANGSAESKGKSASFGKALNKKTDTTTKFNPF